MSTERPYEVIEVDGGVPVKAWIRGVSLEEAAAQQLRNVARLPCVHGWVAAMPDVHWGVGATVGSVIPTVGAIIPAAVGVDIGCGMAAVRTTLTAGDLPESLRAVRAAIERAVPHGRTTRGRDKGAWEHPPAPGPRRVGASQAPVRRDHGQARADQELEPRDPSRHARHGQPLHRGVPGRSGPCLDHAPQRLARGGEQDRHVLHRAGEAGHAAAPGEPPGRGPRVPRGGRGALRRLRGGRRLGAGLRDDEPRGS